MNELVGELIKLGVLGIVLGLAFLYILRKDKEHKAERAEWSKSLSEQMGLMNEQKKADQSIMEKHTTILTELSTLLKVEIALKKQETK